MAYCTAANVTVEFKDIDFGANASVQTADVESFIEQADALINSYVGQRYQTPVVAGSTALSLLKRISIGLTAIRIQRILFVKTGNDGPDQGKVDPSKEFMDLLKAIRDDELNLDGATPIVPGGGVAFNTSIKCPHVFKKSEKQW